MLARPMAFKAVSFDLFDTLVDLHMETLPRFVVDGVERRFRMNVGTPPRDSRLLLQAASLALLCAFVLLLYLTLR